ncbi:CAAX protease self-immunity [Pedobacter sp. ok626]|uniref:CPBP family intramembrane glutamic endopeptidase n=1 Tax=Pedobacter sp. ok626 TaxID=1761882 RepID=UPI00088319B5|nr:type II CAAX endopeptidase family protein [Pedobacter sp. ok626]SDK57590.1 CAAX protease self-immunity [Pedobacter sp. ok626]
MIKANIASALLIIFLLAFPHFSGMPYYTYAIICFIALLFYLKKKQIKLQELGLIKNGVNRKVLFYGITSGILWLAFMQWVYIPSIKYLFQPPDYKEYDFIQGNSIALILTLVAAWIIGGLYEELVFRGFIQQTFIKWFVKNHYAFWISAVLTSLLFGIYHAQQGIFGIVPAILGGLYWSALLQRLKGNLWAVIISHATYDTIALTMIYYGVFGK